MSEVKVNSIKGTVKALPDNLLPVTASAWVNFDGITGGTSTIRDSSNVSSVTDVGVGDYTVNFLNALSDSNYAINVTSNLIEHPIGVLSAGSASFLTRTASSVNADALTVCVSISGGQS